MVYPSAPVWFLLSYCLVILVILVVLVVLVHAYVPNPSLYCLALVPFQVYLTMTLLICLVFCLTWNYKVPRHVSIPQFEYWNCLALTLVKISLHPHSDSCPLNSCCYSQPHSSCNSEPRFRIPEPLSEISRLWQKVGAVHKLKPTSRKPLSRFISVKFRMNPELQNPNSELRAIR